MNAEAVAGPWMCVHLDGSEHPAYIDWSGMARTCEGSRLEGLARADCAGIIRDEQADQ